MENSKVESSLCISDHGDYFCNNFFEVLAFIDDMAGRQAIAFVAFFFSIGSVAVAGLFPVMPGRRMPSYRIDMSLPADIPHDEAQRNFGHKCRNYPAAGMRNPLAEPGIPAERV